MGGFWPIQSLLVWKEGKHIYNVFDFDLILIKVGHVFQQLHAVHLTSFVPFRILELVSVLKYCLGTGTG
jgi:hypothetical protein